MEQIARLGFHQINLADDLFTADRRRCAAVCDEILRRGLQTQWTSFARVDTVSDDLLRRMKAAGCTAVSFGIETANSGILQTIRKGITLDQVVSAIDMCARAGVTPCASFILGLPGETPDTIEETRIFGEKIKAMGASYGFHLLAPNPRTFAVRIPGDSAIAAFMLSYLEGLQSGITRRADLVPRCLKAAARFAAQTCRIAGSFGFGKHYP